MSRALVEFDDLTSLHDKIKQLPGIAENAINNVLHAQGIEIVTREMTNLLPKSEKKPHWESSGPHAKESKWSKSETFNLGFAVKSKGGAANRTGSFGYLVFADEGRGPFNPWKQNFSERASQRASSKILDKLHGTLDQILEF